jgi:hypothetical protein
MGIDDESDHPNAVFRSCGWRYTPSDSVCVFSESRMREIRLSDSMSGNRKQSQAKPD